MAANSNSNEGQCTTNTELKEIMLRMEKNFNTKIGNMELKVVEEAINSLKEHGTKITSIEESLNAQGRDIQALEQEAFPRLKAQLNDKIETY